MTTLPQRAVDWMRMHHATASTAALTASGLTDAQRRDLVTAGVLERVVNGAYRFAGVELDELSRCAAICTSRPQLSIAGPTAGRFWRIRRSPNDGLVYVIGPPHSHPCSQPWVRIYRTSLLHAEDIVHRPDGIRLTSPPRTLVDLSRYLSDEALASAIEFALASGMCTAATLVRVAGRLNTPGRPWVRRFLAVLRARTSDAAACESDWELRVADALRRRGIADLQCQVKDQVPGLGLVRFDVAIPSIRWVLEVDVHPEHRTIEGSGKDHRRDRRSRRAGWCVQRVGEVELMTAFDNLMGELVLGIEDRRREVDALRRAGVWPVERPR